MTAGFIAVILVIFTAFGVMVCARLNAIEARLDAHSEKLEMLMQAKQNKN